MSSSLSLRLDLLRLLILIIRDSRSYVLGNIYKNRARSSALGDDEGSADHLCQPVDVFYNEIVLGDRHGHTCDVDLLETVLT